MSDVRWGILGTGTMAEVFAKALRQTRGAILHGVASRRGAHADHFAALFGASHAYRCYQELLQDPKIDIVYVATRNEHHHEDSLAAIAAGKAVLCEKPFALNVIQGRRVVEAARKQSVFCMEAMWMRFSPAVRDVLDIVRQGWIGEPTLVCAQLGFPRSDALDRVFDKNGGGALYDFGVYPLSFLHAMFGRPLRVSSRMYPGRNSVDELFTAILEYDSGCQGLVAGSLCSRLANAVSIHGTDGVIDGLAPLYFPNIYHIARTDVGRSRQIESHARKTPLHRRVKSRIARALAMPELPAGKVIRRRVENGYACEAAAVQNYLRAGVLEAAEMPLHDSLAVLETMDAIRNQWSALQGETDALCNDRLRLYR